MLKNVKIGIKIGPQITEEYFVKLFDFVDFVEIYAAPGEEYEFLPKFNKPTIIHVAHFGSGVNFANPHLIQKNETAINHAIYLANKFKSEKIIFHPELKENDSCTLEVLSNFIKNNYDDRLHIEGMPYSSKGYTHFAKSVDEINYLMTKLNIRYCLDFAHTCEYLTKEGLLVNNIIKYLELKPNHFHITDTDLTKVFDKNYNEEHVNFGKGTMDLEFCKELLPDNSWVTIETPPTNYRQQIKEIEFLRNNRI